MSASNLKSPEAVKTGRLVGCRLLSKLIGNGTIISRNIRMTSFWQSYGLTYDPFSDEHAKCTPYFPSRWEQHIDLLCHLAITTPMVLLVTGLSGVGKTTFMEILLKQLSQKAGICRIHGNNTILVEVMQDLIEQHIGMVATEGSFQQRVTQHLERMAEAKDEFYLMIDDAHQLPKSTLSFIVDIAQWQTVERHPLHFILLGGPQLDAIMAEITAQHLGEVMTHTIRLEPFSFDMLKDYVLHRLTEAGITQDLAFKDAQLQRLYQTTQGIAGKINLFATQILTNSISNKIPKENTKPKAKSSKTKEYQHSSAFSWPWLFLGGATVAGIIFFMMIYFSPSNKITKSTEATKIQLSLHDENTAAAQQANPTRATLTQAAPDQDQMQTEGLNGMVASAYNPPSSQTNDDVTDTSTDTEAVTTPDVNNQPTDMAPATSVPASPATSAAPAVPAPTPAIINNNPPDTTVVPATPATGNSQPTTINWQPLESSATSTMTPPAIPTKPTAVAQPTTNMPSPPAVTTAQKTSAAPMVASLVQDQQALMNMPAQHITLQIAAAVDYDGLKQYIKTAGLAKEVYFFKTERSGHPWFVAVYGDYPNVAVAKQAISQLPVAITKRETPWPRSFKDIQSLIKGKA